LYLVDVTSLRKEKRPTRKQVNPTNIVPGGRDVTKEGEETHEEAGESPKEARYTGGQEPESRGFLKFLVKLC
jgi:hypothetical protein